MLSRVLSFALIATLALSACSTPAPTASPSAAAVSSSSAPSPSPTPEPEPEPFPAELIVGILGVQLYDSDGVEIGGFTWADEPTTALPVLELAFGAPSTTSTVDGDGSHFADYKVYTFSDAFTYYTAINLGKPRSEFHSPSSVQFDEGEALNGVTVRTTHGLRVGGTLAQVLALSPVVNEPHPLGTVYLLDPVDASAIGDPENSTDTVAVIVDSAGTIVEIHAPWKSGSL